MIALMRRLTRLPPAIAVVALAPPAIASADEYDAALRCLTLIEIAKMDYTAENVDALRQASDIYVAEADRTRPTGLSDQEKLKRYTAVVTKVQEEGGLATADTRAEAVACAAARGIDLILPGPG